MIYQFVVVIMGIPPNDSQLQEEVKVEITDALVDYPKVQVVFVAITNVSVTRLILL